MQRFALCLGLAVTLNLQAQQLIEEHFDQAALQNAWYGDLQAFNLTQGQLQLRDSVSGVSGLFHQSDIMVEAAWEYHGQFDFNPSSSNFMEIILLADHIQPDSVNYGYNLRLGGNSKDEIRFYRQDTSSLILLWSSSEDWLDLNPMEFHIRVERDSNFYWRVLADTGNFDQWFMLGQVQDSVHRYSALTGFRCHYTKTRSSHFFLDSLRIYGREVFDFREPTLENWSYGDGQIQLFLNEKLVSPDTSFGFNSNPSLALSGFVWRAKQPSMLKLRLQSYPDTNRIYRINLSNVYDRFGNKASLQLDLLNRFVQPGELRINEIMADPSPKVDLNPNSFPEVEFLELHNSSDLPIDLVECQIRVGSRIYPLQPYVLAPDSLVVICAENVQSFWPPTIRTSGIDWSTSSLPNSGAQVVILFKDSNIIDGSHYSLKWYQNPHKQEGGWSLERVDLNSDCHNELNWRASIDPQGASPGEQNSVSGVYLDTSSIRFLFFSIPDPQTLRLHFDRDLNALDQSIWELHPRLPIDSVIREPMSNAWKIHFGQPITEGELYYLFQKDSLYDCSDRSFKMDSTLFGLAGTIEPGAVHISEALFNPVPGGSDFIELRNTSSSFIDLADLSLANWQIDPDMFGPVYPLSSVHRILEPQGVIAISEDIEHLVHQYAANVRFLHQTASLPSMPDDEFGLVLLRNDLLILDQVWLDEDFHSSFLGAREGVSLYRLTFKNQALHNEDWHSSPSVWNFASPGFAYSQADPTSEINWYCEPEYLSPNGDGHHDFIQLHYRLKPRAWAQADIYDRFGHHYRKLLLGDDLPQEGYIIWKGQNDQGEDCPAGVYIAVLEYRYPHGEKGIERFSFVLSK